MAICPGTPVCLRRDGRDTDYDELLAAIAPRPVLVVQPTMDRDATPAEVKAAVNSARRTYQLRQAPEALQLLEPVDPFIDLNQMSIALAQALGPTEQRGGVVGAATRTWIRARSGWRVDANAAALRCEPACRRPTSDTFSPLPA